MSTGPQLPVCAQCGHKHWLSQDCPGHQWTDACPYEGLDCPSDDARAQAERVRTGCMYDVLGGACWCPAAPFAYPLCQAPDAPPLTVEGVGG